MQSMGLLLQNIYITGLITADSLFEKYVKSLADYGRILQNAYKLLDRAELVFRNPKRFSREVVVLIAAVFLVFLILLLVIIAILAIKKQLAVRKTYRSIGRKVTREELIKALTISGSLLLIITAFMTVGVSQPSLCERCHSMGESYATWEKSSHKRIGCIKCHYEPGIIGYTLGTINGADNLLAHVFKDLESPKAVIANNVCLQCHSDIDRGIVMGEREIKVRHKDFLAGGVSCTTCHVDVAHGAKSSKTFAMNDCISCHDGKKAKSDCETCHVQDIAYDPHQTLDDWPKVEFIGQTCVGCHGDTTTQRCINCHGLELPHSEEFRKHHPMKAEPSNGNVCYKCHWSKGMSDRRMCGCHENEGSIHGSPDKWYYGHREVAKINGAGCNCHRPNFCGRCHDENAEKVYPSNYAGGSSTNDAGGGGSSGISHGGGF